MDKIKGVAKDGWHPPGKDGKSKVASWVGKGKDPHQAAKEHQSRPLASLKDPDAFGPPPKNVNYHGAAAIPSTTTPDRRGLGAPLSAWESHARREREESERRAQEKTPQKPVPPPIPYRADTTGLPTGSLPKPPMRRAADSLNSLQASTGQTASLATKRKPSLPPRLPPREANPTQDPPPSYSSAIEGSRAEEGLNQSALGRLGSAGISVPGLNIGETVEAPTTYQSQPGNRASSPTVAQIANPSELHTRFSGFLNRPPASEVLPNDGTSLAQKQAALKTASSFRSDPSSVSISDAKATATTANNFRERHGDQVTSGLRTANTINQNYNVAGKISSYTGISSGHQEASSPPSLDVDVSPSAQLTSKRKPPPVPLSSKPRF